jgi:4-hydroxy-tetrahydrodipicolinate synthase
MRKTEKKLEGIIPAIITPFDEKGTIDFKHLEKQTAYLAGAGVNGLFVAGTTGEGGHLTTEEKLQVYRCVKEAVREDMILCAACIQPSTRMVLEEVRAFEKWEPDFIVSVTPYYYTATQEDIKEHFREIARNAPSPLILYNIPSRTHNRIELETVCELAREENIGGVKDSTGDFIPFSRGLLMDVSKSFPFIQGEDYLDGPSLNMGARGVVTGLGNVWVEPYVKMYRAAREGDARGVNGCQGQINGLYGIIRAAGGRGIAAMKAALSLLGRSSKWLRTASMTLSDEDVLLVKGVLEDLDLLP